MTGSFREKKRIFKEKKGILITNVFINETNIRNIRKLDKFKQSKRTRTCKKRYKKNTKKKQYKLKVIFQLEIGCYIDC